VESQITNQEAIEQACKILSRFVPKSISLVDELISERRESEQK